MLDYTKYKPGLVHKLINHLRIDKHVANDNYFFTRIVKEDLVLSKLDLFDDNELAIIINEHSRYSNEINFYHFNVNAEKLCNIIEENLYSFVNKNAIILGLVSIPDIIISQSLSYKIEEINKNTKYFYFPQSYCFHLVSNKNFRSEFKLSFLKKIHDNDLNCLDIIDNCNGDKEIIDYLRLRTL